VRELGPNADGELLEPGRVSDCYLGLLLRAGDPDQAPGVLVVSPAALLHPAVPQPDGTLVYELVTGRRRGPKARQERGRADESIARGAPHGAAAPPPRGGPSAAGCAADWPHEGIDQHRCTWPPTLGYAPVRVGNDGGSPASSSRSAGAAHHLAFLDVGG
jgi:hypothetical protein